MGTTILIEQVELLEGTIDETQRTVDVVLIRPGWSSNGRYYPRELLAKAAPLYENAFAFADHQTPDAMKRGESRSVKDITGRYVNVNIGPEGELRATRRVYQNDAGSAVWPVIQDAVHNPGKVRAGLSHTAIGTTKKGEAEGREGDIVEDISAVYSVDDVVSPAAGGEYVTLAADTSTLINAIMESLDFDEWREARPDYAARMKADIQRARQSEQERAAREQAEQAQARIAELEQQLQDKTTEAEQYKSDAETARELASRAEQLIAFENELRQAHMEPEIEKQIRKRVEQAPGDWKQIIEDVKELHTALGGSRPQVTGAPQRVHSIPTTEAQTPRGITPADMARVQSADELVELINKRRLTTNGSNSS